MRSTALFLVVMLLVPAGVVAQEVARSFVELGLQRALEAGETILITCELAGDRSYQDIEAEFGSLTDSAITVRLDGEDVQLLENGVARIERNVQSAARGALWGGPIGVGVGAGVWILVASSPDFDFSMDEGAVLVMAIGAGAGAGIGALAKKSVGRELIYLAPDSGGASLTFAPLVSKGRKGALFTVTW